MPQLPTGSDPDDPQLLSEEDLTRVYQAAVRLPRPGRAALIETGLPTTLVDRAAVILQSRGLLDAEDADVWSLPAPDIAITAWAADAERRARAWRASAGQLHQMFTAVRQQEVVDSGNRELATLADIASASATITAAAKQQVFSLRAATRRTEQLLLDPFHSHREQFRNAAGELVTLKAVYEAGVLDTPGTLEAMRERMIGGEEIRLATGVPFSAIIVDDTAAVVEFSDLEPSGAGSMLLRARPFVRALLRLAEHSFASGVPLPLAGEDASQDSNAERDAVILSLLASGASDSTITRRLGISQRTVERRVHHLMSTLGVHTRFQLGVQAARHGLV